MVAAQTYLLMCRTVRKRFRHPISVTLDYSIFIFTGSILGLVNPGRELPYNVTDTIYNVVAIGLMTTVSNLRTFGPEQASEVASYLDSDSVYNCCTVRILVDPLMVLNTKCEPFCFCCWIKWIAGLNPLASFKNSSFHLQAT